MMRALLPLLLLVAPACKYSSKDVNDHWNAESVGPSMARFWLGYDADEHPSYRDFAWERKQNINLALRRYLLHHNPDNPNHEEWPSRYENRPRNSLLPNPLYYIHLEGLLLGFVASGGGTFIPLPIDSIIGTFETGGEGEISGRDEFMEGVEVTFGETFGAVTSTFAHKWIKPPLAGIVTRVDRVIN